MLGIRIPIPIVIRKAHGTSMKAALGIVLVFTGLTVGYLVLVGKLPMSASASSSPVNTPPSIASQCKGLTGNALKLCNLNAGTGGGPDMQASQPDRAINGHYMASTTGGY
jgi:hypothetical protein